METTALQNNNYANATKLIPHGQQPESEQGGFASFLFGDDGFGLGDIIDTVNPLHHIPVISTFYQNFTGDEIANAPALIGGAVTGGPMGLVSAAANVASKETTDKSIGNHILDLFVNDDNDTSVNTAFANATKLSADNGAAALSLFQSGNLDQAVAIAAKSRNAASRTTTELASTNQNQMSAITSNYSLKQASMGISAPLADIKA